MPIPTPNIAHNTEIVGDVLHNISLNYKWRQIVGGQLSRLLHRQFWDGSEAEIDDTMNQLHDLIHDLYTSESTSMAVFQKTASRITDINFSANLDVPVQFNSGDYDLTNNSRVYADETGKGIVTANAHIATLTTANIQYCFLRRNGIEVIVRSHLQAAFANGEYSVSWSGDIASGDYFELCVRASSNSKVSVVNADANLGITVFTG